MIYGIVGKIGTGKDTVASIVQELYPDMNWQIKGFADKLRHVASLLTGISSENMKKQEVKESLLGPEWNLELGNGKTQMMNLRGLLQKLGTEAIRNGLHSQAWVNALFSDYKPRYFGGCDPVFGEYSPIHIDKIYPNWLITDCRFPNEYESIISRQGTCIRIVRPDNPYPQSNHPSETSLDHIELLTIINDGNLEQLRLKVKEVFDPIVKNAQSH